MRSNQSGAALFVALILLAILMVVGVTAVKNGTFQEKMAINMHQANWAYNAASAGINAFNNISNVGDYIDDTNHLLYRARYESSIELCIDEYGQEGTCGSTFLDGDKKNVSVKLTVTPDGCKPQFCPGVSLGGENPIYCQIYKVVSLSDAAGIADGVEFYGFQYSKMCNTP